MREHQRTPGERPAVRHFVGVTEVKLTELIASAPWREAITYRKTWPHEYVLLQKDDQRELLEAVCERLINGEGVPGRFFAMRNRYLFIGEHKYWLMIPPDQVDWDNEEVLNRAPLYRDRRDFVIQDGDSGMKRDYPINPEGMLRQDIEPRERTS